MKKIFLITLACFLMSQVFSQGKLTFFSQDGKKFWVIINGEKMNKEPSYNVKEIPVTFQWGKVRIIFEDEKIKPIDKNVQVVDVDNNWCHVKYMIKSKKGKYTISDFDATFEVLGPVSGGGSTQTNPQPTGTQTTTPTGTQTQTPAGTQTQTTTTGTQTDITQTTQVNPTGITTTVTDPITGQTITTGVNIQVGSSTQTVNQTTTVTQTGTTTQQGTVTQTPAAVQGHYIMPGYNGKVGCPWPMKQPDFEEAKKSIVSKNFEDSKLTVAKQITGANCLMCSQVKEIMLLFNFEDSKLDFAKYAYDYVYDLNNYYKLNDAFNFESTIDELNQYVNSKKK